MQPRDKRVWDGKAVTVQQSYPGNNSTLHVELKNSAGSDLALAIKRLQQTSLMPPETMQELADALDYVLVGDPASYAAHRRMEAGKGMTPDGGHLAPGGSDVTEAGEFFNGS